MVMSPFCASKLYAGGFTILPPSALFAPLISCPQLIV